MLQRHPGMQLILYRRERILDQRRPGKPARPVPEHAVSGLRGELDVVTPFPAEPVLCSPAPQHLCDGHAKVQVLYNRRHGELAGYVRCPCIPRQAFLNRALTMHGHPDELDKVRGNGRSREATDPGILQKPDSSTRPNFGPYRGVKESTSLAAGPHV
jgi:hypothetical protein